MITLTNDILSVSIAEKGAEIRSVIADGKERMWCGDANIWSGVAPLLFPICGGLKDDKYTLRGVEYTLNKHGFARKEEFIVEELSNTCVTFLLKDNEQTLKQYPWHFELRVIYTLIGDNIKVEYKTTNTSDNIMYYSIGSHEAYSCPEGIDEYDIIFSEKEDLYHCGLDGNLLSGEKSLIISNSNILPLKSDYFSADALVFKDFKSRSVTLKNRNNGNSVTVDFNGFNYLLFWHVYKSKYMCIEPWCGIPALNSSPIDIETKEGIRSLKAGETETLHHTIKFNA